MKNLMEFGIFSLILFMAIMDAKLALAQMPIQNSDAEILKVVAMIDTNEIQMARLAEEKNIDPHLVHYARMLDMDHRHNLDRVHRLSSEFGVTLNDNSTSMSNLRTHGQQNMLTLSPLDQDDFSAEFIGEIIKGHSDDLTWIDSQQPQDPRVKSLLNETWYQIAKQLKKAQAIREGVLK